MYMLFSHLCHFGHLMQFHGPGNQSSSHCVAQNPSYKGSRSMIEYINEINEDNQDDLKRTLQGQSDHEGNSTEDRQSECRLCIGKILSSPSYCCVNSEYTMSLPAAAKTKAEITSPLLAPNSVTRGT